MKLLSGRVKRMRQSGWILSSALSMPSLLWAVASPCNAASATLAEPSQSLQPQSEPASTLPQPKAWRAIAAPEAIAPTFNSKPGSSESSPMLLQPSIPAAAIPHAASQIAQQAPDPTLDRQPTPLPSPEPIPPSPPLNSQPSPPVPTQNLGIPSDSVSFEVRKIEVEGSSILGPKELAPIIAPLEGRAVTLAELRKAADTITQLYLDRGFITSRAVVTDQTVKEGVVQIRVIEGGLESIEIEGTQRLSKNYVRSRIQLAAKTPLSRDALEDQLRLLKVDPLFTNVEASLRPGTQLGKSILVVRVAEAPAFSGYAGVDNYSPPSVGSVRLGGGATYRNLTGLGDELSAAYFRTTRDGANIYDLSYRLPVNAMNGTVQLRYAPNDNKIVDSNFKNLNIRGQSELFDLSFRQPLKRSPREEFALSLGLSIQNGQTFLFNDTPFPFGIGPDDQGNSRTRVLKFGQEYVKRDPRGAWALRSQFSLGLDLFNATVNSAPVPDGRFFSWLGQLQRVQRLSNDQLLIVQADVQLTPDSLLPSQQFVIGGGQSLRGFRQNARSGDNGLRLSIEDRIAIDRDETGNPTAQLAPFLDLGTVWNKSNNPNKLPDQTFLAAVGLGLLWQPAPKLNLRLDYAIPLVKLKDKGNDAQDEGFYFSVNYQF